MVSESGPGPAGARAQVQSAVLMMLRSIKWAPKISHSLCRKVIQLFLEFVLFHPKALEVNPSPTLSRLLQSQFNNY